MSKEVHSARKDAQDLKKKVDKANGIAQKRLLREKAEKSQVTELKDLLDDAQEWNGELENTISDMQSTIVCMEDTILRQLSW
jgi:hypothetical protein